MRSGESSKFSRYSSSVFWTTLAVVGIWLAVLACLPPVWGSSEAREAHVVALMHSTAEYILPLRNGLVPSKPPLFHWIGTVLMELAPIAPITAARWVSVLSAVLILVQVSSLARRFAVLVAEHDAAYHNAVRWLAPALLLTSYGFVTMSTDARVDMCFAALVVCAVAAIIGAVTPAELRFGVESAEEDRRFSRFFILCGLATVAKGPLGIVLPGMCGVLWYLASRGWRATLKAWMRPRIGWLLLLFIALPWYLLAALKGGQGFVGRQLLFENIQRLFGGEFVNAQPWYFYVQVTLLATLPWSLLFIATSGKILLGVVRVLGGSSTPAAPIESGQRVQYFLCAWYWVGFLLFSCASGKRPSYLLPLLPAVALQVALVLGAWGQRLSGAQVERYSRLLTRLIAVLFLIGIVTVALLDMVTIPGASGVAGLVQFPEGLERRGGVLQALLGAALVALYLLWRRRAGVILSPWPVFVLWFAIMSAITSLSWIAKGEFKGFEQLAARVKSLASADTPLRVVRGAREEYFDPILYYLDRPVELQLPQYQELRCPGFTLARASWFEAAPIDWSKAQKVLELQEWRAEHLLAPSDSKNLLVLVQCAEP